MWNFAYISICSCWIIISPRLGKFKQHVYIYISMASTWSTWFSLFAFVWCTGIAIYAAWRGLCPILKGGYLKVCFLYRWWSVTKEVILHCLLHPIVEMKITCLHINTRYSAYCAFMSMSIYIYRYFSTILSELHYS